MSLKKDSNNALEPGDFVNANTCIELDENENANKDLRCKSRCLVAVQSSGCCQSSVTEDKSPVNRSPEVSFWGFKRAKLIKSITAQNVSSKASESELTIEEAVRDDHQHMNDSDHSRNQSVRSRVLESVTKVLTPFAYCSVGRCNRCRVYAQESLNDTDSSTRQLSPTDEDYYDYYIYCPTESHPIVQIPYRPPSENTPSNCRHCIV